MKTIWLASYPKSGNTWFRLLIANLRRDTPVDINALPRSGGIAGARGRFDEAMMFPSGLLSHDECDRMRPGVYRAAARARVDRSHEDGHGDTAVDDVRFVKAHDAYTETDLGEPLLGGAAAAAGAILIVRDPRDVAPSFAHHRAWSIDRAIAEMAAPQSSFCGTTDRQHHQLRQQLLGWSRYHAGWLAQRDLPLHVVRYEDMQADTIGTMRNALRFAGVPVSVAEAAQAARFASFDALRRQESDTGFREAPRPHRAAGFFRRGEAGGWRDELTPAQSARIVADHGAMMTRFDYRDDEHGRTAE